MKIKSNGRRAISPVIAALMISAVVLAVGGAVWAFSQGAATITAEDYAEGVINMTETISERFIIEHVSYVEPSLYVWIYNHGDVDIEVKVQVGDVTYTENWIGVASKDMVPVDPILFAPGPGENELNIKVYSRRGNNAFYMYILP